MLDSGRRRSFSSLAVPSGAEWGRASTDGEIPATSRPRKLCTGDAGQRCPTVCFLLLSGPRCVAVAAPLAHPEAPAF